MATCEYLYTFSGDQKQGIKLVFDYSRTSDKSKIDFSGLNFQVKRSGTNYSTTVRRDAVLIINTTNNNYCWIRSNFGTAITNNYSSMLDSDKSLSIAVNKFQDITFTIRAAVYNFNGGQGFLNGLSAADGGPPWSSTYQFLNGSASNGTISIPNNLNYSSYTITKTYPNSFTLDGKDPAPVINPKVNNGIDPNTTDARNLTVSWTRPSSDNDSGYYKVTLYCSTNGGSSYAPCGEPVVVSATNSYTFYNLQEWSENYKYKAEVQTLGSASGTETGIHNSKITSSNAVTLKVPALVLTAANTNIKIYTGTTKVTPQLTYTSGADIFYSAPGSTTYIRYNSTDGLTNPSAGTYKFKLSKSGYTDVTLNITLVNSGVPFTFTSARYGFYYNGTSYSGYKTLTITSKVSNSSNKFWVGGGEGGAAVLTSNGTSPFTIDIGNTLSSHYSTNEFLKNFSVTSRYQTSEVFGSYTILDNQFDKKRALTYNASGSISISGIINSDTYYNTITLKTDYDERFSGNISFKIGNTTIPFTISNTPTISTFTLNTANINATGAFSGVYFGESLTLYNSVSKGTPPITAASFSTASETKCREWPVYTTPNFHITINTTLASNWNNFTYSLFLKNNTSSTSLALSKAAAKFTAISTDIISTFYDETTVLFKTEMTARFPQQIQNVETNLYIGARINNEIIQMFPVTITAIFDTPYTFSEISLGSKTLKAGSQKNITFKASNLNPYKSITSCSYSWKSTDAYTTTTIGANSNGEYNLNLICPTFVQTATNTFSFKIESQIKSETYCYFAPPNIVTNISDASFSDIIDDTSNKNFNITIGFYDPGNTINGTDTTISLTNVTLRIPNIGDFTANSNTTYTFKIPASLATSNLTYQLLFEYTQTCTYENEPVTFTQDIITDSLTMFGENPSISIRNKVMGINIIPESDEDYFLLLSPLSSKIKKIAFTDGSKTGNVLNIIGYIDLVNKTIDGFTISGGTW